MRKIFVIISLIAILVPSITLAAEFNPNYIISDNDMIDNGSLTLAQIQKFLENKGGYLSTYRTYDQNNNAKLASQIIYDAANYYGISSKVLLTILQKEQSLITDPDPSQDQLDWATGYGVCDSCSKDDPSIQQYKGFYNQVNWAAKRNRQYIEEAGRWNFVVGGTYIIDSVTVTMENQATVNLYTYTPHLHGNEVFWTLWNRWFIKKYPDGSLLQVQGERGVYLIQNGKKRPFLSKVALISGFDTKKIILVSKSDLDVYEDGAPIKFPNFSILESPAGRIYLIVENQKRYITSPEVFRKIGFNPEEVIKVSDADLVVYEDSDPITIEDIYPTGVLLQSKETGGITYVQNGVRHSIWSKEILNSQFKNRNIVKVDQASIDQYPKGEPVKFKDGDLVTSPNANGIYVISNGQRRGIRSKAAFEALGYKWQNVIKTTDQALFIHPEGEPIDVTQ